jgi:hypothetical protein
MCNLLYIDSFFIIIFKKILCNFGCLIVKYDICHDLTFML